MAGLDGLTTFSGDDRGTHGEAQEHKRIRWACYRIQRALFSHSYDTSPKCHTSTQSAQSSLFVTAGESAAVFCLVMTHADTNTHAHQSAYKSLRPASAGHPQRRYLYFVTRRLLRVLPVGATVHPYTHLTPTSNLCAPFLQSTTQGFPE